MPRWANIVILRIQRTYRRLCPRRTSRFALHREGLSLILRRMRTTYFASLSALIFAALACSPGESTPMNQTAGAGGDATTSGGSNASGGAGAGGSQGGMGAASSGGQVGAMGGLGSGGSAAGGAIGNTGGEGVGGGSGGGDAQGSTPCPAGSDAGTPVVEGKTPTLIDGVPEGPGFLEGPVWYDGKLFLSQIDFLSPQAGNVLVYTPGSGFETFAAGLGTGTNGMAIDQNGTLFATSHVSFGIISFDANDPNAAHQDVTLMYEGQTYNSPNDITVRSDGTIYFTDPKGNCTACPQPIQGVYRYKAGGSPELIPYEGKPNGIALSPDEQTLYVAGDTLRAYPVQADGSVGTGQPFGDLMGIDGIGVDCAGNVYAALYNMGQVVAVTAAGTPIAGSIAVPEVTNIAFGGAEGKTMYITSFGDNRGQLRSVEMEVRGLPF